MISPSLPLYLIGALLAVHTFLPFQHTTSKFLYLSHRVEHSGLYVKGHDDIYFVFFWVVAFTFIRAFMMDYIFVPFAARAGISSKKDLARFAEQAWSLAYYLVLTPLGTYLAYNSPYWFNLDGLWLDWPHRELQPLFKFYYLVQLAFWLQQIFVLNIEKRRKDFTQMFTHHIVTSVLLVASYNYCFTRSGNVILCLMDVVDIALSSAKMLKYLGFQTLCDCVFGIFILLWIITKHILYVKVTLSAMFDAHHLIGYKCFFDPLDDVVSVSDSQLVARGLNKTISSSGDEQCFTELVQYSFVGLLWILQVISLIWLYMIFKVAIKVVTGAGADDSRSDDEEEDELEHEKKLAELPEDADDDDDEVTLVDSRESISEKAD
ncbi:TLC domain-containing protein [Myxozyma melibiosi]|uniref:TLC domain-containing protein n=1 Tax=Myxozyma melibiosi TaxID=54550 RepID=A0ABR1F985_9ASCO